MNNMSLQLDYVILLHKALYVHEKIGRGLGLGLCKWTTFEFFWIIGGWIRQLCRVMKGVDEKSDGVR